MTTPALAIEGKVVPCGHLPAYEKLKEILVKASPVEGSGCEESGGCSL